MISSPVAGQEGAWTHLEIPHAMVGKAAIRGMGCWVTATYVDLVVVQSVNMGDH